MLLIEKRKTSLTIEKRDPSLGLSSTQCVACLPSRTGESDSESQREKLLRIIRKKNMTMMEWRKTSLLHKKSKKYLALRRKHF